MSKAKRTTPKPVLVDSVEIRLSNGQSIVITAREIDAFCLAGFRRIQAEKLGQAMPKTRFTGEWELLEEASMHKENRPLLQIALAVVQRDDF